MISFRQKLYLSYLIVFLVFLALLFPFASRVVESIIRKTLSDRTTQMIGIVRSADTLEEMKERLEDRAPYVFFRVSLMEPNGKILYDSHIETFSDWEDPGTYYKTHPELAEAIHKGVGYSTAYSNVMGQRLMYVAKKFVFQNQQYIMRVAFPLEQVQELTESFELGFLTLGVVVLILFSLMTSLIALNLSRPIQKIIGAVKPYQEGRVDQVPMIEIGKRRATDDFQQLADTLNQLNIRVQNQISTLKDQKNEKVAVLESLVEGVIAVDSDLVITHINGAALKMLGLVEGDVLNHHFETVGNEEFQEMLVTCQREGEMVTTTVDLGGTRQFFLDVIAAPKGTDSGAILVLQDKSIHYQALEMRKDFIANASHELKTPLTIVRGFAEAIHDNPDLTKEVMATVTEKIIANCDRMERLVKNLLRLADIENLPRKNFRRCRLVDLLKSCRQFVLSVYPDAVIEIKAKTPDLEIYCDADLLELAITNLLDNGAKYSKAPAHIDVVVEQVGEEAKITVTDQGIGIPQEDIDQIFHRFYTVDKAHSRKLGGSGLGLSIVETIVHKHFGTITLESELGVGSTFTIVVPVDGR